MDCVVIRKGKKNCFAQLAKLYMTYLKKIEQENERKKLDDTQHTREIMCILQVNAQRREKR